MHREEDGEYFKQDLEREMHAGGSQGNETNRAEKKTKDKRGGAEARGKRARGVQGYLGKCGSGGGRWRRRWLTLVGSRLSIFKGKSAVLARTPNSVASVAGGKVYLDCDDEGEERRLSVVMQSGSLLLEADDLSLAAQWHQALVEAASRSPDPSDTKTSDGAAKKRAIKQLPPGGGDGVATLLVVEIVDGPWEGSRFEIGSEGVVVCRNPNGVSATHHRNLREVHIPDGDISRRHAEVGCEEGVFRVKDLGSLNGTFVNGERLSEERKPSDWRALSGGDTLSMGKSKMDVFFRVKVLNEVLSKSEIEKRARKAERRKRREERREQRTARRAPQAAAQYQIAAPASSKIAASAASLLNDVLGGGARRFLGEQSAASHTSANSAAPSLRPNKSALDNILGAVVDHNERLEEEAGLPSTTKPPPPPPPAPTFSNNKKPEPHTPSWLNPKVQIVASLPLPPPAWLQPPLAAHYTQYPLVQEAAFQGYLNVQQNQAYNTQQQQPWQQQGYPGQAHNHAAGSQHPPPPPPPPAQKQQQNGLPPPPYVPPSQW